MLLIDGEEGIGKSRLLRESVHEAANQGFSLAAGTADQLGRTIPFFASRTALREPLGKLTASDHHHDLGSVLGTSGFSRPSDSRPTRPHSVLILCHDSPASQSLPVVSASAPVQ